MRKTITLFAVVAVLVVTSATTGAAADESRNFVAPLSGDQEAPPVDSQGTGVATFKASKEGTSITFRVNVANLDDVVAAHIHCGPVGVNGPVAATLFFGSPSGPVNGTLATGVITEPMPGNACAFEDLDDLLDAMRSGATYVNVHTLASLPGEIRGQIK